MIGEASLLTSAGLLVALAELTVVLLAASAIDRVTATRWRPSLRHGLWALVAMRMLLPPGAIRWSTWTIATAPIGAGLTDSVAGPSAASWMPLAIGIWAIGAGVLIARWVRQARAVRRRVAPLDTLDAEQVTGRIRRLARRTRLARVPLVSVDPSAAAPYVTSFGSPRLVLPHDWRRWSSATLDHALGHELMHLRRRDLWLEAVWMLIVAVYWFHPLAHLARRRAHDAREMCCDADTARLMGPQYRVTMLRLLAAWWGERGSAAVVPGGHRWHPAIARLHALERWPSPPARRGRLAGAMLLAGLACVIIPSHTGLAAHSQPAVSIERLIDPASRQALGMGSLHLRYALVGAHRASESSGSPVDSTRR